MAKQKQTTETSEAALSAIEHALGLYGVEASSPTLNEADTQADTKHSADRASTAQATASHLPRIEDAPFFEQPPSINNLDGDMQETSSLKAAAPDGAPQAEEATLSDASSLHSSKASVQAEPEKNENLGVLAIKLPISRANKEKPFQVPREEKRAPRDENRVKSMPDFAPTIPGERQSAEPVEVHRASVLPANDDTRASVAEMLEPLSRSGSRLPEALALLASVLWSGGMYAILTQTDGILIAADGTYRNGLIGALILSALAFIGPILFFFSMATLSRRSREMRISAKVMAEVAARLAEPEVTAAEGVFTLGQAVRREVASIGDGIERALSRAGDLESLVHGEVAALERSYAENEYKMRSLVGELSAEREAIMATAERIRLTIDAAHQGFTLDIDKASSNISEAINEAGDRVTFLIGGKQDEIVATLDRSASHAAELIGLRTYELGEKISVSSQDAANSLLRAGNDAIMRLTTNFDEKGQEVIESIGARAIEINEIVQNTGANLLTNLEARSQEVANSIEVKVGTLVDGITQQTSGFVEKFEMSATGINELIQLSGSSFIANLEERGHEVTYNIEAKVGSLVEGITQQTFDLVEKFETSALDIRGVIQNSGTEMLTNFEARSQEVTYNLEAKVGSLVEGITQQTFDFVEKFEASASDIRGVIQNSGTEMLTNFEARSQEVTYNLEAKVGSLVEGITQQTFDLVGKFEASASDIRGVIQTSGAEMLTNLEARGQEVAYILESKVSPVVEGITQQAFGLVDKFDASATQIDASMGEGMNRLSGLLDQNSAALAATLSERITQAHEALNITSENLGTLITTRSEDASQQLSTAGRVVAEGILQQANRINEALASNANQLATTIHGSAKEIGVQIAQYETSFAEKSHALEQNILIHGDALGQKLVAQADSISGTIGSLLNRIETGLDERAKSLGDVLALRTLELSRLITESSGKLENVTTLSRETAEEAIQRAETLARTVTAKVTEINTLFDENGMRFIKGLEGHGRELLMGMEGSVGAITTRLTISMAELNEAVSRGSAASLTQLSEANDQLRDEVTTLLGKLGEANTLLGSIVGTTTERLGDVESKMADRVDRLEKTLAGILNAADEGSSAVLEKIEAIKNGSDEMFSASGSLTDMLGKRTGELQTLATQLNETQKTVGDRLLERQDAFENLARTLNARIEDVDSMLRSFASLVTEQLSTAQKQARETSSIVLEASENATTTISAQYERVRQEAGKERERTATALRQTYEQANGEMSTLLKRALDDFSVTANEVREVSADIIRDIEVTRRALAEGGLDIPQKAKIATASLKRVVQDQLRAVSELGEIATKSGTALDVAEPRRDDARRDDIRRDETRRDETRRDDMRREPPPLPRSAQKRPASDYAQEPASYAQEPLRPALYAQPEIPPAPRYDNRAPTQTNRSEPQRGGSGWLSGMLERAADEERAPLPPLRNPTRAPEPASSNRMEALDSLSVDIARMIDHDMAVDLWERYRRGERNVFTRRLYTLQGQDTYDEIRRRYRHDADFRQTVDAYILQFERLLSEVAGDDRDSSISRAYLTSETGKVYTMLAHAAGRFD